MADIFISYSQKDRAWVKRLVDALTAEGWEVWWDLEIRAGESFDRAIERTLDQVGCVISVWSDDATDSDWVRAESAWAKKQTKLVSIRIQDELELPIEFFHVHTENFAAWDGSRESPEYLKLLADIRGIAGRSPNSEPKLIVAETAVPRPVSEQASDETLDQRSSPSSKEKPARDTKSGAGPESGPKPARSGSFPGVGGRIATIGIASLAVVAVALGVLFIGGDQERETVDRSAETPLKTPALGEKAADPTKPVPDRADKSAKSASNLGEKPGTLSADRANGTFQPLSVFHDRLSDGSEGPEMVVIPAGEFQMGCKSDCEHGRDELPLRAVSIDTPFAIGKYEVTVAEYGRFAEATGAGKPDDGGWSGTRRPVINVSWDQAVAYAEWLSAQTGKRYRLPTEAEWEYTARAGTETPWSFGAESGEVDKYAWHQGNAGKRTRSVGTKEPNPWGLHDVHGNIAEWVQDCWNDSYQGAPDDGSARESGDCAKRVIRGGSWSFAPLALRSADRTKYRADYKLDFLGFRLARDL